MSVSKPRNRLVFFRVSEDDFQKLAMLCQGTEGARSISELARSAVHRLLADSSGDRAMFVTMEHLDRRIDELQRQVRLLTAMLGCNGHTDSDAASGPQSQDEREAVGKER